MKVIDRIHPEHGELRARYSKVRGQTEALASPLSAEDQTVQSMPDVSPTKWHLAHTSWFFETFLLKPFHRDYRVFSEQYETLFNSYYNAIGQPFARARRGLLSRPGKDEVLAYRHHVDQAMEQLLVNPDKQTAHLVELGLQHEEQHQELLLTDIKHVLAQNPLHPVYIAREDSPSSTSDRTVRSALDFVPFEGGIVHVGHEGDGFHFDNEAPRHRVLLADFELATRPLNNQDVLSFIEAGGYENPLLWLSDGWQYVISHQITHPLYYEKTVDGWMQFTLHGLLPLLEEETACHLSYFEADAIARFLGARLPTEFEWEHAASLSANAPTVFNQRSLSPGAPNLRTLGLAQLLGGVWEWTQSAYAPYPGYEPAAGAVGEYNGKFMHNQYVLRGGSLATPTSHVRITYRNFFPSSTCFQFSGARLAKGKNIP